MNAILLPVAVVYVTRKVVDSLVGVVKNSASVSGVKTCDLRDVRPAEWRRQLTVIPPHEGADHQAAVSGLAPSGSPRSLP